MTATERLLLHSSATASTVTGIVIWVMKDLMPPRDEFSVLGHPWQPHILAAHVLVGPVVVFALGLIARGHVLQGLRDARPRRGRWTGVATAALAVPMVLTGYLLQVVTSAGTRWWLAAAHILAGALFALLFFGHVVVALIARRPRRAATSVPTAAPVDPPGYGV
jgi:hypothetical protein